MCYISDQSRMANLAPIQASDYDLRVGGRTDRLVTVAHPDDPSLYSEVLLVEFDDSEELPIQLQRLIHPVKPAGRGRHRKRRGRAASRS